MKNLCARTRDKGNPYEIWEGGGWKYEVLKKYQASDDKPFARWFCFVISPFCPDGEYGDCYASEVRAGCVRTFLDGR